MTQFSDLPLVSKDEVYEINRRTDLYFLNQSRFTAHGDMTCSGWARERDTARFRRAAARFEP